MGINPEINKIISQTPVGEWTKINLDKESSFEDQDLVRLGFLMDSVVFKFEVQNKNKLGLPDINGTEALKYLADGNDSEAAYKIGERLIHGLQGEEKDIEIGLRYLNKAGDLGHAKSLHRLATYYNYGYPGIIKDQTRAFDYYLRAAKLGFAGSQNNVAWHYYKGEGVEKNLSEAIYWVTRSIEQGEPFGYSSFATMRFEGNGFIRDDIETYKWTLLASNLLPDGKSKQEQIDQLKILSSRMSEQEISQAKTRAANWSPLRDGGLTMLDKDDQ